MRSQWKIDEATPIGRIQRQASVAAGALSLTLIPSVCRADGALRDRPAQWSDWSFDLAILVNLALIFWLYARGWSWRPVRGTRREEASGQRGWARIRSHRRLTSFCVGLGLLGFTLLSPLDAMASQLSSAHMVQHMVLMTIVAPLLVVGAPGLICFCGTPAATRRGVLRVRRLIGPATLHSVSNPWLSWTVYAAAIWAWHLPVFYQAALENRVWHDLQHLSFLAAAFLFWRVLLDPVSRNRLSPGLGVLYLFTTTLHATVLGVFMTLSPVVWYPAYEGRSSWWGLSGLEDQQLAGLIMWMPACFPYAVFAAIAFASLLSDSIDIEFPRRMPGVSIGGGEVPR